jgi:cyanophycinase-like exopeptidase
MKLYLFGGAETKKGEAPILKRLINEVLTQLKPKQLLHIPYARIEVPEGEEWTWGEGWVKKELKLEGIKLLDARNEKDLAHAKNPAIFMNGGPDIDFLYEKIASDKRLHYLVTNANYIISESAGSMVTGEYRLTYKTDPPTTTKGLGILKNTIIEPHYTQRGRQQALRKEMKECGAKYGIGIDSITGIVIDTKTYPEKYEVLGNGLVELIKKDGLK